MNGLRGPDRRHDETAAHAPDCNCHVCQPYEEWLGESAAQLSGLPEWQLRPVQNNEGTWDALDGNGYGHVLEFRTAEWVETWIDGYNTGARENA